MRAGMVVKSIAGRDQGRLYAVVRWDESRVWIADGKQRKLSCPKPKNRRHLQFTQMEIDLTKILSDKALKKSLTLLDQND